MKSLKKKRRVQIIVAAAVALALAAVLIGYGFRDGINLYRAPSQMAENPPEAGEVFRLGGLVETGTLTRGASETVTFKVTDGGTGDNDLDINSVIKDPGGVAINKAAPVAGATTPVPTLGDAARSLLALMLAGAAALVFRRQRR